MKKNSGPQPSSSDASSSSFGDADSTPLSFATEPHVGRHSGFGSPIPMVPSSDGTRLNRPKRKLSYTYKGKQASSAKRPKKQKDVGVGSEEGKKSHLSPFPRLWSDDDVIVLLDGFLEYEGEKGADPMVDTLGFYEHIKSSFRADFDRRQVFDKLRGLKKRYANTVFSKKNKFTAHEQKAFDLSAKIWGNDMDDAVVSHQRRTGSKAEASNGVKVASEAKAGNKDSAMDNAGNSCQFIGKWSILRGLDENLVRVGLELCKQDRKAEIEDKWRKLCIEESEIFIRKLDLAREESKMIVEALKSGGSR